MQTPQEQLAAIFTRLTENAAEIRNADLADIHDLFTNLEDQISDILHAVETERDDLAKTVRDAVITIDIAFTHHDDAERFGWTDRDTDAWTLITDAFCDLEELAPLHA